MRISTAYFAGVGTVIVAVAAGLGGGYLAANIANPPQGCPSWNAGCRLSRYPSRRDRRSRFRVRLRRALLPRRHRNNRSRQTEAAAPSGNAAPSTNNVRVEEKPANNVAAVQPVQPTACKSTEQKSAEQTGEKAATPRDAFARARDADVKRADAEKRRAERRQLWAERRRVQQPREQELEAVEERVREVTEPRRIRIREEGEPREMFAEPARTDTPRIRLFDQDN